MNSLRHIPSRLRRWRFLLPAALMLAVGCSFARIPQTPPPAPRSIASHRLSIEIDPERGRLSATDEITMGAAPAGALRIALSPAAVIRAVSVAKSPVPFRFENGVLSVELSPAGAACPLTVTYDAAFSDNVPDRPVNTEDPTYGVEATIRPEGTFLSGDSGWHPALASFRNGYRIRISAPEGYEALTDGKRLLRTTEGNRSVSEWDIEPGDDRLTLVAARYVIRETRALDGAVPVYSYFSKENDPLAEKYLAASARYLAFYRDMLGPYPFPKFAVADNFFPTGYGFHSWTLLGANVVRLPFILDTSLGHEIAHSWWGNGVRVRPGSGNWSEGITSYVADYLYDERASPEKGLEHRLKLLRDYATLVPRDQDFPLRVFTSRNDGASRAIGYGKAAMLFHMSRIRAGDDHFWSALRRVAREKMGKEATWEDFAWAFERESGKPFGPFFSQWVDRAGAPVLSLEDVTTVKAGNGWVVSGRVTQPEPAFDLAVPLRLEVPGGGTVDRTIEIRGTSAPFSLKTAAWPKRLVLDPDVTVFRRLAPEEIPPTVNHIKGSDSLRVIVSGGATPGLRASGRILLDAMGQGSTPFTEERSATAETFSGHDLLFLGTPGREEFLRYLPSSISVAPGRFSLDGAAYDAPGYALFTVFQNPVDKGRHCALFLALSDEAADKAAPKIVHYGKYGNLVFSDGGNRLKGTGAPGYSKTIVEFPVISRDSSTPFIRVRGFFGN